MDPAHLHLLVIHFPIAAAFLALPLLAYAWIRRAEPGATGAAALVLAMGAAGAVVAVETGEGAEDTVEGVAGFSDAAVEEHEERAEAAMALSVATGLVGLLGAGLAFAGRAGAARLALGTAILANSVTAGAMAWTGEAGGRIRHTELGGTGLVSDTRDGGAPRRWEEDADDDD